MNDLGDAKLRDWSLHGLALFAADTPDQLAWLGERDVETKEVVEEVQLICSLAEGLTERGAFGPEDLRGFRAIGRCVGEIGAACRPGLWAGALLSDPAWDEVRLLARHLLLTTQGDWRQPLPRPMGAHPNGR
ncbi:hypothetical protein [Streptomyces sp. NPDC048225]|uniref:hypothetical protein n=1 Tax=Streptomyces sp. NPDC048225 TaxID=3365518 RepID=UPI00371B1C71